MDFVVEMWKLYSDQDYHLKLVSIRALAMAYFIHVMSDEGLLHLASIWSSSGTLFEIIQNPVRIAHIHKVLTMLKPRELA